MKLSERIEAMERLDPDVDGKMLIKSWGDYLDRDEVLAVIREWDVEQAKQPESDFGGFDPNRPWVNDWARWRAVDADGEEFEFNQEPEFNNSYMVWDRVSYRTIICNTVTHKMTGKDWTKSKQERK